MYKVQMLHALSVAHMLANRIDMLWQRSVHALTFTAVQDINRHPCYLVRQLLCMSSQLEGCYSIVLLAYRLLYCLRQLCTLLQLCDPPQQ